MQDSPNLQFYNELIGRIFIHLMQSGLERKEISAGDFIPDDFAKKYKKSFDTIFIDTVTWLTDEGYIRHSRPFSGSNASATVWCS